MLQPRAPHFSQIGGLHVELSFLSWFENNLLSHAQGQYQVTWYLSWSPCCNCAQEVAKFLATNRNVKLTIFIARLYYPERRQNQVGLRQLVSQGVMMKAMSLQGEQGGKVEDQKAGEPGAEAWRRGSPHGWLLSQTFHSAGKCLWTTTEACLSLGKIWMKTTAGRPATWIRSSGEQLPVQQACVRTRILSPGVGAG